MNNKFLANIEIKNAITLIVLLLWVGVSVFGLFNADFEPIFEFVKQVVIIVVSYFLGANSVKSQTESTQETTDSATTEVQVVHDNCPYGSSTDGDLNV